MTRYDLMKNSTTLSQEDKYYKDPLTLPLSSFKLTTSPLEYNMKEIDVIRPDILSFRAYGTVDYYDIVFLLNNIGYIDNIVSDEMVYIPDRADLENFFLENQV